MQHCWPVGLLTPDKAAHEIAVSVDLSGSVWMIGERMDCLSSSVDAADAKKAEGASI